MIIAKPNEVVRLPISLPVSSSVTGVTLERDIYEPIFVPATSLSAYMIEITIPSGTTAGQYDWFYGNNKGMLEVELEEDIIVSYDEDATIVEYPDAVWGDEEYNTNNLINDNVTNLSQTWSSQKITDELANINSGIAINCYTKQQTDALLSTKASTSAMTAALATKADSSSVYTKAETNTLLGNYYTKTETYNKTQIQGYLSAKADVNSVYTTGQTYSQAQVNALLANKADSANTYTKAETNTLLNAKADKSNVYTKAYINSALTTINNTLSGKANSSDVYTTAQTYNKVEVDSLLAAIATFEAVVVSALPQVGDTKKMYFVPKTSATAATNVYEEYLWVRDVVGQGYHYELVGETGIDMSNYYTKAETYSKTETNTLLNAKQETLVSGTNIKTIGNQSLLGSGNIWAVTIDGDDLEEYDDE